MRACVLERLKIPLENGPGWLGAAYSILSETSGAGSTLFMSPLFSEAEPLPHTRHGQCLAWNREGTQ